MTATLVTISFSHFCEKARWALERAGVRYEEEGYAPILHLMGTRRRGGRSTPLLQLSDGRILKESSDIVRYAEAQRPGALFPEDASERAEVEALMQRFDDELGPAVRRIAYHAIFASGGSITELIRGTSTGLTRAASPLLGRALPPLIRRGLKIDGPGVARSRAKLQPLLADVEARLADGRDYLVGGRFTAADLTFASLYSPIVLPDEQPVTAGAPLPPGVLQLRDEARARPAGRFAQRIYRDERAAR